MMADTVVAGERVGLVSAWAARISAALPDRLAAEGERRLLWLPVFFGAGIGVDFMLRGEPPLWPGVVAAVVGAGLSFALRRHPAWCETALALTVFAAGFALMGETAWERQAPVLQRHLGPVTLTGRVVDIDLAQNGWRIVVEPDSLVGLDPAGQPRRVRLHIPRTSDELNPGDQVRLKAMLYPVLRPPLPDAFLSLS
jgi:competence protein ComEC